MPVIDARVRLPLELRPEADRTPPEGFDRYEDVLGLLSASAAPFSQLMADLDNAGIERAVVHAEHEQTCSASALNDATAELVGSTDRLRGVGTVELARLRPGAAAREARRCHELGLLGINLQPAFFDLDIDDRRLYPVYAECEELGLVVSLHSGVHYSTAHGLEHERPVLIDRVAVDFPGLVVVACHGAWPWVAEMCAVARRHPQVMIELGGLAPKYVAKPGSGWDPLRGLMDTLLSDQVLFASDWPAFDPGSAIEQWRDAELKPATLDKLLESNAARLYGW